MCKKFDNDNLSTMFFLVKIFKYPNYKLTFLKNKSTLLGTI